MGKAARDLAWLLDRGYAMPSSLKLVGDRYALVARQRVAIARATCSLAQVLQRRSRQLGSGHLAGLSMDADGYNVLTTVEAAMAGGVILRCRDGCYRDMASMHGSFHRVEETEPAATLLAQAMAELGIASLRWYLDSPVSNSGRLKTLLGAMAHAHAWNWSVELVPNPDAVLAGSPQVIATADSVILDGAARWFNLTGYVIDSHLPGAWIVDLGEPGQ